MRRVVVILPFLVLFFIPGRGQIRLNTLVVEKKQVYELQGTDIIVVDTLILRDSARLILNASKKDNFIHVKKLVVGSGSVIDGRGKKGDPGKPGNSGSSPSAPCRSGNDGQSGIPGTSGGPGVNLFLYITELQGKGKLLIDVTGGDGGEGGEGGSGGDGNAGSKLCQGGNGGAGGTGGAGGNGGNGGNVTITSMRNVDMKSLLGNKIIVRVFGGFAGLGGDGGLGGQRGLSSARDGEQGKKGQNGTEGIPGKPGGILFEKK